MTKPRIPEIGIVVPLVAPRHRPRSPKISGMDARWPSRRADCYGVFSAQC